MSDIISLDIISFLLALFSIVLSYWFWKNPIEIKVKTVKVLEDVLKNGDSVTYKIIINNRGWSIEKITEIEIENELKFIKLYASRKNNPSIAFPPESIEEIRMLSFN